MRNVQSRTVDAPTSVIGQLVDGLAGPDDQLWPTPAWPPLRLDRGLAVGSRGGHGPIRYHVTVYEPGRRVRFQFEPSVGLDGYHEFRLDSRDGGTRLIHEVRGRTRGRMRLLWPLAVRWLHEALLHDLLDNAERVATATTVTPNRYHAWVRILRRLTAQRPQATQVSPSLGTRTADLCDAWSVSVRPGMPTDAQAWADAVFRDPPIAVRALLLLRNKLVRLIGVPPASRSVFDTVAGDGPEVLLGVDDVHLDFRAAVTLGAGRVTVSTVAAAKNWRGRLYLAVVKRVHPAVVKAMLSRAQHRLSLPPRPTATTASSSAAH